MASSGNKDIADEIKKQIAQNNKPHEIMTARALQKADLPSIRFIVAEILPQGLALLTAPSKYGKSWLTLDLCLSVAEGEPFLGFNTEKCGVFYLALEDSYRRLKKRMNSILKDRIAPECFSYAINAPTLDNGLDVYLRQYIKEHPETGLIAIDVLQKVRSLTRQSNNPYAAEYADLSILKNIADEFNIVILVLHHNRKMTDGSDPFNMISGTMAIMGTSDVSIVLHREKRTDEETTLSITGRDVEEHDYKIKWDKQTCRQQLVGSVEEIQTANDEEEYNKDPVVITIKGLLKDNSIGVVRTASDFLIDMARYAGNYDGHTPHSLAKKFPNIAHKLYLYDRIIHKSSRRNHTFSFDRELRLVSLHDEND